MGSVIVLLAVMVPICATWVLGRRARYRYRPERFVQGGPLVSRVPR